ncbi:hypothetical protein RN001_010306 [Aquatica leii]|uniref:Peroxin-19 n=1 Tax=Aquatica leii TaxID=1421715 RepID=A0AAN7SQ95_9COLE|nr:hypothetical protein RN001_010306 [Aquatica leii]
MSKESDQKKVEKEVEGDEELADLLDSALKDFTKDEEKTTEESQETNQVETDWSEEFIKQAADQFETNMMNLLRESSATDVSPDQVQQTFQRMAAAAAAAVSNTSEGCSDADFSASIADALRGLAEDAENLQNPFSESDIRNMFAQSDGDQNAFVPFMQGMMQSLLSKDVLYPSLKEILAKYPAWLEANGASLTDEERTKYEKQQQVMNQVCEQLEKESDTNTLEEKQRQFETVLSLMQRLQDYGQPPTELVGDLSTAIPFDAAGNPNLNQCCLM